MRGVISAVTDPASGKTIQVPVRDSQGNIVQSKEALRMKQSRLDSKEVSLESVINVITDFVMPPTKAASDSTEFSLTWLKGGP